jgi:hypothetical protein
MESKQNVLLVLRNSNLRWLILHKKSARICMHSGHIYAGDSGRLKQVRHATRNSGGYPAVLPNAYARGKDIFCLATPENHLSQSAHLKSGQFKTRQMIWGGK